MYTAHNSFISFITHPFRTMLRAFLKPTIRIPTRYEVWNI